MQLHKTKQWCFLSFRLRWWGHCTKCMRGWPSGLSLLLRSRSGCSSRRPSRLFTVLYRSRRRWWRSTHWYLWRPALLVAEARQLLLLALLWWLVCKKERTPWDLGTVSRTRPYFSSHYVWGLDAEVMSAAWRQNVRSWSSAEASSMYTWASLQMRWDWFMVFCVTSMTPRIRVMSEWLSSK